ncbi:DUF1801 domain-containing protein [Catenovulum adriaticum]|uniref:DUF1801 domain-containing protein n=1 Tax=Catenovulum adriaticum TaxID=2984846 RepID=A0ABY7AL83_9ALTE|nr:DUF1801 domain-containing protein [Catenovulum sp. TS8]WAJ69220.1 DUF1801 domain-containing protein [Catenovulum sp. TS8]
MDLNVQRKFKTYPKDAFIALMATRKLIIKTAKDDGINGLTETLKWGEPSYISSIGSTIRFDWKEKTPQQYYIYFHCQTKLIACFKELYGDIFVYDGNRAIVFKLGQEIPINALTHCISLALRYKKIKHVNLLGA